MKREEQFAVGERPRLDVDVPTGSVQVVAGDAGRVHVTLDAGAPDHFEIAQLGDTIAVRSPSGWLSRGGKVHVVVELPAGSDVAVNTATADVIVRVSLGAIRVRTASGDVRIEQARHVEVHAASGDVRVGQADDVQVTSASGDITIDLATAQVAASTASGDIRAEHIGGSVAVGTTSGDVRLHRCTGNDLLIKTVSGDVSVGLPSGIRVDPDINTLSGRTTLPAATALPLPRDAPLADRRRVRLRIRTVSGNIRIDRIDS